MPLHVHELGPDSGRPIVALHGLRGHGRRWRQISTLLPAYRILGPDLRGCGKSPHEPPWTLEQHASDVLESLDLLGLQQVDVLAHSFGGAVAVYLARMAPERVGRLVLLDPSIGIPAQVAHRMAEESFHVPDFGDPEEAATQRAATWPPMPRWFVAEEVADHLRLDEDGRWRWNCTAAMAVTTFSELARPAVAPPPVTPTLLVLARDSAAAKAEYLPEWRATLGENLTIAELDCGHHILLERPVETAGLVESFFN